MLRIGMLAAMVWAMWISQAQACDRCGLFGKKCRYYAVATQHVDRYRNETDVFVVQNNYPQPLVGQGATLYASTGGYQQLVAPLLDPNLYFSQELQLLRAAGDANALRSERTAALFGRALELQAPVAEKLATGQAAKMVLDAAGLSGRGAGALEASGQAVVIDRDAYGRVQIRTLTAAQVQALSGRVDKAVDEASTEASERLAADSGSMLGMFCAKCHGLDKAEPKGALFLGDDANVARAMREKFFAITRAISTGTMPPAGAAQPDDNQRAAILNEIEAIIVARKGE